MAKLADVAALAGVSVTTASRVINHKGYLSQKTIDKVHAAMAALNYQPNQIARAMAGKPAKFVGLIFPSISTIFFAELVEEIERHLSQHDYKAILCNSEQSADKEREILAMLAANQVDGIISSSHNLEVTDYARIAAPIVSFDRELAPEIPIVSSDNYQGGVLATTFLIQSGARNCAIFAGSDNTNSPTHLRTEGYWDTMQQHGLPLHIIRIPSGLTEVRRRAQIKKALADGQFDGIFCTDDLTALLVKKLLEELHHQNARVVGFDGARMIENYIPSLTTIQQPTRDLAALMVETLLKQIDGKTVEKSQILPVKLINAS
ncbi:MAG: LacI family DNA-binding transcriptional regulator [Streptococcaceae bacterium]|jgi:LacI family sucrose operon transcriptional repressor|nr:LacI family DNA-binding transcriptional regulator [Streptococcaceae bacterium]